MTTINDIARITGYSKSTVSRALKGSTRISQATRDKICATARELDYLPNSKAVSLSLGRSGTIGVIVPYVSYNSYFDRLLYAIIGSVTAHDYKCLILPSGYDEQAERAHLDLLRAKEIDGLIITSAALSYDVVAAYLRYGMIVSCEYTGESGVSSVTPNRSDAYSLVLDKFIGAGITSYGLCFSRTLSTSHASREIMRIFETKLPDSAHVWFCENCRCYEDGLRAGAYFAQPERLPRAIFANSDEIGAGIMRHYEDQGLTPPCIIGQEGQVIGEFADINSIDFHQDIIGRRAVEICLSGTPANEVIPYELRPRTSPATGRQLCVSFSS